MLEDYKPHVFENCQRRYAMNIIEYEFDTEHLEWALKFLKDYERKHKTVCKDKQK